MMKFDSNARIVREIVRVYLKWSMHEGSCIKGSELIGSHWEYTKYQVCAFVQFFRWEIKTKEYD